MARQLIVNYIEHTDVSIKIMAVQIGKDSEILIDDEVLSDICYTLGKYPYEMGGIIGVDKKGVISAFQFDETYSSNPFEYCPNVDFLNKVINEEWAKRDIEFVGFVHSHLNNDCISNQDIEYAKQILNANRNLQYILIGVFDLSKNMQSVVWKIF